MASLFIARGPDDPTKACIPFHLAVNGAAWAGIEAAINLAGDTVLIQDRYIESLTPLGLPLRELMAKAIAGASPFTYEAAARSPWGQPDRSRGQER